MGYDYTGKILRINLSTKEAREDKLDDLFYRNYYGGACLGAYFLLKELNPGTSPFSPENIIIFSTSPLTGIDCSGTAMHNVITKSPLTNLAAESTTPGYLGSMIKKAGYDGLIIRGKAIKPAYLYIDNNQVKIEDACDIWGKTTSVSYKYLKEKHGIEGSIALIGPAGENLVRYAAIVNDNLFLSSRICDYSLDGTSLGITLGFAIECYENGLITREDTGGIDLKWGDRDL